MPHGCAEQVVPAGDEGAIVHMGVGTLYHLFTDNLFRHVRDDHAAPVRAIDTRISCKHSFWNCGDRHSAIQWTRADCAGKSDCYSRGGLGREGLAGWRSGARCTLQLLSYTRRCRSDG